MLDFGNYKGVSKTLAVNQRKQVKTAKRTIWEVKDIWVSKKKWNALEKKIADLEVQVQSQQEIKFDARAIQQKVRKLETKHG